jgi:ribosomal protein S4
MIFKRKNNYKPLYKQFIRLGENVQNRQKLFKFKKQKWSQFINRIKWKLKRYKKYKPQDQMNYVVSRYPNKWDSYKKGKYRNILYTYKKFSLLYGGLSKKSIKRFINQALNNKNTNKKLNLTFLKLFESRLDTILYRAKFSLSIRAARQMIGHGKIFVNNVKVKSLISFLKPGDIITLDNNCNKLIERNLAFSNIWPIPPKYLVINYKTFQIIFGTISARTNVSSQFSFNLNLEKLLIDYLKH